jgi:hypothetical protein
MVVASTTNGHLYDCRVISFRHSGNLCQARLWPGEQYYFDGHALNGFYNDPDHYYGMYDIKNDASQNGDIGCSARCVQRNTPAVEPPFPPRT